jgi:hypothetical protein
MRFGTFIAVGIAAVLGACTSQSVPGIDPVYVAPSTFENLTCRQLGEEAKRITSQEAAGGQAAGTQAAGGQDSKPTDANNQLGVLKGAMDALEQVSIEKGCNIQFQHESAGIENTRQNRSLLPDCYPPLCTTNQ